MKVCEIEACEKPVRTAAASWCNMHYIRWWRHGDPSAVVAQKDRHRRPPGPTDPADVQRFQSHCELRVTRRDGSTHVILYDLADAELVESRRWSVSESNSVSGLFYARTTSKQARTSMHVLLMGRPMIDHINHNGLDNRRSNLRPATKSQNSANSIRRVFGKSSTFRGVGWREHAGKWVARIAKRHLGYFETETDAARAYDAAAREAFGEFASLNFPGDDA